MRSLPRSQAAEPCGRRKAAIYELKNCRDGSPAVYPTAVEITDSGEFVTFRFTAAHSSFYCPFSGYNKLHSSGDACEMLIGSDPLRREYYEIEISAGAT